MDNHKWMKDIDRKMDGFEMPPPEGVWEGIEKAVKESAEKQIPSIDMSAKHSAFRRDIRKTVKWSVAAVFAGVIVCSGGLLMNSHWQGEVMPSHVIAHRDNISGHSSYHKANENETTTNAKGESMMATARKPVGQDFGKQLSTKTLAQVTDTVAIPNSVEIPTTSTSRQEVENTVETKIERVHQEKSDSHSNTHMSWYSTSLVASHNNPDNRFSVSLSASNFLNSSSLQDGYGELVAGTLWKDDDSDYGASSDENEAMEGVIVGNSNRDVYTKKKHRQPIKVGVSVNYRLTNRLSIGTGLAYSYLSSDLLSGTEDYNYTTHQSLQYLGIPLNLNYTMFQGKRWCVYSTGGGMVEKCVKGNSTTDYIVNGEKEKSQNEKVKENRLQYSVNAAVGIQIKATENVGFYIEPGISYHFDNHSDVTNIYKDTPLNFSLGIGLRYSF